MYTIHTTPAFILRSVNIGEANKLLKLFTRNFGLVFVTAQSIRKQKSRLRGFLQRYGYIDASLVQGKRGWKLTTASLNQNFFYERNAHQGGEPGVTRMFSFIERFIQGEEQSEYIFDCVLSYVALTHEVQEERLLKRAEYMTRARILRELGYVDARTATQLPLETVTLSTKILRAYDTHDSALARVIDKAVEVSQL